MTITNAKKEFIANSKTAIFYNLIDKVKLTGNFEVITTDMNKIKASEVIYYLQDNTFEANAGQNQKANTKLVFMKTIHLVTKEKNEF